MSKQGPIPKAALPFCENLGLHHNRSMIRYSNRYMHTHGIGLSSHTLIVPKIREEALLFVPMYCPTPKLRHPTAMIMSPTATDPKVCSSTQIIIATTRPIKLIAVPAKAKILASGFDSVSSATGLIPFNKKSVVTPKNSLSKIIFSISGALCPLSLS